MKIISSSQFREIILKNHKKLMEEQKDVLLDIHYKWKGKEDQTDDITIAGLKFYIDFCSPGSGKSA